MDRKRGQQPTDAGRREEPFKTKKVWFSLQPMPMLLSAINKNEGVFTSSHKATMSFVYLGS